MIFDELRAIQRQLGYLPADRLRDLARKIDVPVYRLHGLATFYPHFRLTPPPKADVCVCQDMSCHLRGADELRARLEEKLHSPDVVVRGISCLGRCDQAPAVSINDRIYADVSEADIEGMIRDAAAQRELPEPPHTKRGARCASDPYASPSEHYGAVRRLVQSRDWNVALETLKASGLRGLGGAGFPTESKWQLVRQAPGPEKYIVCNADESEPGTFKDRFILTHVPHLVVEGMILAGLLTGARKGVLYLRHEYAEQEEILEEEIRRCEKEGLLGDSILGSEHVFDLELFVSPGGYICGEESALLEALEGKRAEPRNKPPFPVTHGLWNKPTVINNVETFANVPSILVRGVEWYKGQGVGGSAGLKFIGVSGDVVRPGVYEVPMGTPVSQLIFRDAGGIIGGKNLKAFAPSGPSSGYLPASMADVRLDFKALAEAGSMLGSGALVVCAEGRCMLDMALNSTRFFRNESCGKCVPCRVGSQKLVHLLAGWTKGEGSSDLPGSTNRRPGSPSDLPGSTNRRPGSPFIDLALIDELSEALRLTSICGLGQVVPAPISSVLKHFRAEVEGHILKRECVAGVCFSGAPHPSEIHAASRPA